MWVCYGIQNKLLQNISEENQTMSSQNVLLSFRDDAYLGTLRNGGHKRSSEKFNLRKYSFVSVSLHIVGIKE